MSQKHPMHLRSRNRQRSISLAVAVILVLVGIGLVSYALASQKSPPQPPVQPAPQHVAKKPKNPPNKSKAAAPDTKTLDYSKPVSLSVPSIDISASPLSTVGKQADGSAGYPKGAHVDQAAWYKYSPAPGEYGASVILGHVDTIKSGPSIFFDLGKMKDGEKISVKRADGKTAVFTVTDVQSYPKSSFPTNQVYSAHKNGAELRLITCGGAYNQKAHSYTTNVVVSASLSAVRA